MSGADQRWWSLRAETTFIERVDHLNVLMEVSFRVYSGTGRTGNRSGGANPPGTDS
jgi:hypothetical protein